MEYDYELVRVNRDVTVQRETFMKGKVDESSLQQL